MFSGPQIWFLILLCLVTANIPDVIIIVVDKLLQKRARFLYAKKMHQERQMIAQQTQGHLQAEPTPPQVKQKSRRRTATPRGSRVHSPTQSQSQPPQVYVYQVRNRTAQDPYAQLNGHIPNGDVSYINNAYLHEPVMTYDPSDEYPTRAKSNPIEPDTISLYSVFYRF